MIPSGLLTLADLVITATLTKNKGENRKRDSDIDVGGIPLENYLDYQIFGEWWDLCIVF